MNKKIAASPIREKDKIIKIIEIFYPKRVDVVDFHRVPQAMKDAILKDGILWKS